MRRHISFLVLGVVVVLTVACDQITKHMARVALAGGAQYQVLGGIVTVELAENEGAFLSIGARLSRQLRLALASALVVALLVLAGLVLWDTSSPPAATLAVTLLVAGGGSNLIDRFCQQGRVTDFLLLQAGPLHTGIFNVADLAIMAGAVLFFLATVRKRAT